ncbi:MAG TPA: flagellar filament outer layer protein FlaA [Treponemataceae bacterium]|nr:flagellar filament outer layer protein FlaA [Treponemataceae bacterium]
MKKVIIGAVCCLLAVSGFAQSAADELNLDAANPALIGAESAQQKLKEVSIDKFENEGTWAVYMSPDEGIIKGRLFDGAPAGKKPIPDEEKLNIPDDKVYGVKVEYFRRGYNTFTIKAVKPLPIEGIAKTLTVWVVGRNYNHTLKLLLQDYWGTEFELYVGRLKHSGWKLMTVAIPPQNPDGKSGIIQKDYHYGTRMGLKVVGFKVECDPDDAYGSYYVYLDDMRVVSDLYEVEARDKDDMNDTW